MAPDASYFVDRQKELTFFSETINEWQGREILLIQGPDGIGKTALLHEFERECRAAGLVCAHINFARREYFSHPNFLTVATDLWDQLGLGAMEELYEVVSTLYRGEHAPLLTEPVESRSLSSTDVRTAPLPTASSLSEVIPHTPHTSHVISGAISNLGPGAQAAIGANITQIQNWYNQVMHLDDARVIEPLIRRNVTEAFQVRMKQLSVNHPIVILLDYWEGVLTNQGYLKDPGAWICDDILNFWKDEQISNCLAVISCAKEPELGDVLRFARRIELTPLSETAARDYFANTVSFDLPEEALADLMDISQGIPLAMQLLADGTNKRGRMTAQAARPHDQDPNIIVGYAIDRYLERLVPTAIEAVRVGAVTHRLDKMLLVSLGVHEPDIDEIIKCSFVLWDDDGEHFTYHQTVRMHLLEWWNENNPNRYRQLNRRALEYFTDLVSNASKQRQSVYEYEREVFYHRVIDNEDAGFDYLTLKFEEACQNFALGHAQGFVDQAVELEQRGILTISGRAWLDYFQARLYLLFYRDDMGEGTFRRLADQTFNRFLLSLSCWSLGNVRVEQHRWSEGVRLYQKSLDGFREMKQSAYVVRIMLSLGNAYYDLARASGGLSEIQREYSDATGKFLYVVQHFPFLVYEQLVRRNRFLPNPYFGTNYQNWIVGYLLIESAKWYRRAEGSMQKDSQDQFLFETQLSLVKIDHYLNRWARARHRYAMLMDSNREGAHSFGYRKAQVRLGYGRSLIEEKLYDDAKAELFEALKNFEQFGDKRLVGITTELLGQIYTVTDQPARAINAYEHSLSAYAAVADSLAHTRVISRMEDLVAQGDLPDKSAVAVNHLIECSTERRYIVRFPDQLLCWFRRLALVGALPLTYILTFILGLALVTAAYIAEGEILLAMRGWNAGTALTDVVILISVATLPALFSLWFYRFIYTVMGVVVVYFLGRRLSPIEREQPRLITCNDLGVSCYDPHQGVERMIIWSDVDKLFSIDYYLWRHPIELISRSVLTSKSGATLVFETITSGYSYLMQDVERHLKMMPSEGQEQNQSCDFFFFSRRWTIATVALALIIAVYLVLGGFVEASYGVASSVAPDAPINAGSQPRPAPDQMVFTVVTPFLFAFVPTWLLLNTAVILWRLVFHQFRIQKIYGPQYRSIPVWLIGFAAVVLTILTILWLMALH